jgi:hypothetical protein
MKKFRKEVVFMAEVSPVACKGSDEVQISLSGMLVAEKSM